MYRFVVKRTHMDLLIGLSEGPEKLRETSKRIDMAYAHLNTVMQQFEKEKIVRKEKQPHSAYDVVLTEKGEAIVNALIELKKSIELEG